MKVKHLEVLLQLVDGSLKEITLKRVNDYFVNEDDFLEVNYHSSCYPVTKSLLQVSSILSIDETEDTLDD